MSPRTWTRSRMPDADTDLDSDSDTDTDADSDQRLEFGLATRIGFELAGSGSPPRCSRRRFSGAWHGKAQQLARRTERIWKLSPWKSARRSPQTRDGCPAGPAFDQRLTTVWAEFDHAGKPYQVALGRPGVPRPARPAGNPSPRRSSHGSGPAANGPPFVDPKPAIPFESRRVRGRAGGDGRPTGRAGRLRGACAGRRGPAVGAGRAGGRRRQWGARATLPNTLVLPCHHLAAAYAHIYPSRSESGRHPSRSESGHRPARVPAAADSRVITSHLGRSTPGLYI
jgi:hypothetical protein